MCKTHITLCNVNSIIMLKIHIASQFLRCYQGFLKANNVRLKEGLKFPTALMITYYGFLYFHFR